MKVEVKFEGLNAIQRNRIERAIAEESEKTTHRVFYAQEGLGAAMMVRAFFTKRDREIWVDENSENRMALSPTDAKRVTCEILRARYDKLIAEAKWNLLDGK